jgi:DNA-binding MarR family transcriptional regulator
MTGDSDSGYKEGMTEALSRRLKQPQFSSAAQEAALSVIVAANTINERLDRLCEEYKITRAQYNVLRILRGVYPGGHPRSEIVCRMLDRASDVTRLVDRLQARRLVKRTRGSRDQRQAVTCITAKGIKLLEAMQPHVEAEAGSILSRLGEDNCRELSRLCALLLDENQTPDDPQN